MTDWNDADSLEDFEEQGGDLPVLDHLVPAEERADTDVERPAALDRHGQSYLDSMRDAWQDAEAQHQARLQWPPAVLEELDTALAGVVQAHTPSAEDHARRQAVVQHVDDTVRLGLEGTSNLHISTYGSFLSGLYSPSGDLDLSIEGHTSRGEPVASLGKQMRARLLRALGRRLTSRPVYSRFRTGRMQQILHARVPILKFVCEDTGIPCDVSVGSANSQFKAHVLRALGALDPRFAALVRAVKVWAAAHGVNDASSGTFNSFALSLMVLFHLQQRDPPVLPPLHVLFKDSAGAHESRPLYKGRSAPESVLECFTASAEAAPPSENTESLAQLLGSFFARFGACMQLWREAPNTCDVRASTWRGAWTYEAWPKVYVVSVEDPFDVSDNCARTIHPDRIARIAGAFGAASEALLRATDSAGVEAALAWLFQGVPPPGMPIQAPDTDKPRSRGRDRPTNRRNGKASRAPGHDDRDGTWVAAPNQAQARQGPDGQPGQPGQLPSRVILARRAVPLDNGRSHNASPPPPAHPLGMLHLPPGQPPGHDRPGGPPAPPGMPAMQPGRFYYGSPPPGFGGPMPAGRYPRAVRPPGRLAIPVGRFYGVRGFGGILPARAVFIPFPYPGHHPRVLRPSGMFAPPPRRLHIVHPPFGYRGPLRAGPRPIFVLHPGGMVRVRGPAPPPGFPGAPMYLTPGRPQQPPPMPAHTPTSPHSPAAYPHPHQQQQQPPQRLSSPFHPHQQAPPAYHHHLQHLQGDFRRPLSPYHQELPSHYQHPHRPGAFPHHPGAMQQAAPPYGPQHQPPQPQQHPQQRDAAAPHLRGGSSMDHQPYYERQVDAVPTQALRQMLNLGGGSAGGVPMHMPPPPQHGAHHARADPGEAIMEMLQVRRGYEAGDEGGAAAAQPPAQDGAPRRMSRRDSFGLPDSLDLGTLHIGPGSPPVVSDRSTTEAAPAAPHHASAFPPQAHYPQQHQQLHPMQRQHPPWQDQQHEHHLQHPHDHQGPPWPEQQPRHPQEQHQGIYHHQGGPQLPPPSQGVGLRAVPAHDTASHRPSMPAELQPGQSPSSPIGSAPRVLQVPRGARKWRDRGMTRGDDSPAAADAQEDGSSYAGQQHQQPEDAGSGPHPPRRQRRKEAIWQAHRDGDDAGGGPPSRGRRPPARVLEVPLPKRKTTMQQDAA